MDIGLNTEFKAKLTPKDDKPVFSQSLFVDLRKINSLIAVD